MWWACSRHSFVGAAGRDVTSPASLALGLSLAHFGYCGAKNRNDNASGIAIRYSRTLGFRVKPVRCGHGENTIGKHNRVFSSLGRDSSDGQACRVPGASGHQNRPESVEKGFIGSRFETLFTTRRHAERVGSHFVCSLFFFGFSLTRST